MPLVRMVTSVACDDLPGVAGAEVTLPPERAQQVVAAGWGELVREARAESPERPQAGMETAERAVPETVATEQPPGPETTAHRSRRRNR